MECEACEARRRHMAAGPETHRDEDTRCDAHQECIRLRQRLQAAEARVREMEEERVAILRALGCATVLDGVDQETILLEIERRSIQVRRANETARRRGEQRDAAERALRRIAEIIESVDNRCMAALTPGEENEKNDELEEDLADARKCIRDSEANEKRYRNALIQIASSQYRGPFPTALRNIAAAALSPKEEIG